MTCLRRAVLIACALATLASLALIGAPASARANAADSLAPHGAAHNWLPKEGWVWMHWLPFEEPELASALRTSAAGLRSYLSDDMHMLATLAHRRHWRLGSLARHLTRRFDGRVPKRRLAALRWRTERMLTQGHLAQHVLYHTFHGPAVPAHAQQLFGITRDVFLAARQQGLSPTQLALRVGRNPRIVRPAPCRCSKTRHSRASRHGRSRALKPVACSPARPATSTAGWPRRCPSSTRTIPSAAATAVTGTATRRGSRAAAAHTPDPHAPRAAGRAATPLRCATASAPAAPRAASPS
jgi:hypothetical protein